MAIVVERKRLSFWEKLYLPQIVSGLFITFKNIFKPRVTLEYPDQSPVLPVGYRGAPTLVKDASFANLSARLRQFASSPARFPKTASTRT